MGFRGYKNRLHGKRKRSEAWRSLLRNSSIAKRQKAACNSDSGVQVFCACVWLFTCSVLAVLGFAVCDFVASECYVLT